MVRCRPMFKKRIRNEKDVEAESTPSKRDLSGHPSKFSVSLLVQASLPVVTLFSPVSEIESWGGYEENFSKGRHCVCTSVLKKIVR